MNAPPKVMLVDDDALILKMAGDQLYEAGYAVQLCQHPTLVVPTAKSFGPDVVVLDYTMPILSGREVLRSLRAYPELSQTMVVLLTGSLSPRDELRVLVAGASDVWRKPLSRPHLDRLADLLAERAANAKQPGGHHGGEPQPLSQRVLGFYRRERRTQVLCVNPGTPFEGRAELKDGQLAGARLGPLTGTAALDEMLALHDGVWRFEDAAPAVPGALPAAPTTLAAKAYRPRALMVDDNEDIRRLYGLALERAGFTVESAEHGERALKLLSHADFDVVVADLNMPVLDGWGLLRQLKADPRLRETPVLFLSAHDDYRQTLEASRAGAADYLAKTGHTDELVAKALTLVSPRRLAFEAMTQGASTRDLELSRIGAAWLLRTLGDLDAQVTLDASDEWGTYRVELSHGRLSEATARAGEKVAQGVLAVMSLIVSRGARGALSFGSGGLDEQQPMLLDVLTDALVRLREYESDVIAERLETSQRITVDGDLAALYARIGTEREVSILAALSSGRLDVPALSAQLNVSSAEVSQGLSELLRRGVISLA